MYISYLLRRKTEMIIPFPIWFQLNKRDILITNLPVKTQDYTKIYSHQNVWDRNVEKPCIPYLLEWSKFRTKVALFSLLPMILKISKNR